MVERSLVSFALTCNSITLGMIAQLIMRSGIGSYVVSNDFHHNR
jgi:hypothetical protein